MDAPPPFSPEQLAWLAATFKEAPAPPGVDPPQGDTEEDPPLAPHPATTSESSIG